MDLFAWTLPEEQQGLMVLGSPLGAAAYAPSAQAEAGRPGPPPAANPFGGHELNNELNNEPCLPPGVQSLCGPRLRAAFASLDPFDVEDMLVQPCHFFSTPPAFLSEARFAKPYTLPL